MPKLHPPFRAVMLHSESVIAWRMRRIRHSTASLRLHEMLMEHLAALRQLRVKPGTERGETYFAGERRWTTIVGNKPIQKSEILVRIFDPVANTSSTWSSSSQVVKVVHWAQQSDNTGPPKPFLGFPSRNSKVEKLGTKMIGGISTEGIRVTYAAVPQKPKGHNSLADVHECWYSPELKLVILEKQDSPSRSFTGRLESITRGEPDLARYQPPATYGREDVEASVPTQ